MSTRRDPVALFFGTLLLGACSTQGGALPVPRPSAAPRATRDAAAEPPPASRGPALPYPASREVTDRDVLHGVTVPDPFRWLEDAAKPDVKAWMDAQNALTRAELDRLPERAAIAARLRELF